MTCVEEDRPAGITHTKKEKTEGVSTGKGETIYSRECSSGVYRHCADVFAVSVSPASTVERKSPRRARNLALLLLIVCVRPSQAFVSTRSFGTLLRWGGVLTLLSNIVREAD